MTRTRRPARWRYLINGVILVAPGWFLYAAFNPGAAPQLWPEQRLGPYTAALQPADADPPYRHDGEYVKDFSVHLCDGCARRIRTAYLRVAPKPPPLPSDGGGVVHGHGAVQHVHAPYPPEPRAGDRLWLTIQSWDGRSYHASWPLEHARGQ